MIDFLQNFHFTRPLWLLASLLPIIFYIKYFKGTKNKSSWEKVCDKNLLNFLLIHGSAKNRKNIGYIALAGFLITIAAIAGPTWNKKEIPNVKPENPVMIVLNLSSDMSMTDLKPNRINRAKYEISDLLSLLNFAQIGIIVYTDEPFLITPITEDKNIITNLLPKIDIDIMPNNGDRLDRALVLAVEKFKNAEYNFGNIIVVTSDVGQRLDLAIKQAESSLEQNYKINVINVSTIKNEKLDLIAKKGGGISALSTTDGKNIKAIVDTINQEFNSSFKTSENTNLVWEEYGYYLSIVALILCLYFFRKGILIVLITFTISNQAQASFFLNDNEEGLKFFNENNFEKSSEKFKDSNWLGSSLYRMDDFENAYKEFAKTKGETSIYNQGNALAKSGKIEEAIKKYEEVLKLNPKHEDAKFNLEYLKQEQENQSENQNQNQESKDQEQDKNKNQEEQQKENAMKNQEEQDSSQNEKNENSKDENSAQNNKEENQKNEDDDSKDNEQKQSSNTKEQKTDNDSKEEQDTANSPEQNDEDWDEEIQAREQQYREIPENSGGLLRAFIKKEYMKNRYKD